MWQEEDVSQHNNVRILSAVWHDAEITICNPLSNESNETEIFRYIFEYQMLRVSSEMFKVSSDHVASLCSSSRCLGVSVSSCCLPRWCEGVSLYLLSWLLGFGSLGALLCWVLPGLDPLHWGHSLTLLQADCCDVSWADPLWESLN